MDIIKYLANYQRVLADYLMSDMLKSHTNETIFKISEELERVRETRKYYILEDNKQKEIQYQIDKDQTVSNFKSLNHDNTRRKNN